MGCIHDTANIPRIRLRVGVGRSHPERESSSPCPEMQLFSEETRFSENSRDTPARGFLFPQPPLRWALGRFLKRDAPSAGRSATRFGGFFCQATSTGGGAHHMTLLGRAVPPILLDLEGKGKGSHAYGSMANS